MAWGLPPNRAAAPPPPPASLVSDTTILTGTGDDDFVARRRQAFSDWARNAPADERSDQLADMRSRLGSGEGDEMFPMTDAQKRTKAALLAEQEAALGPPRDEALIEALNRRRPKQRGI